MISSFIILPKFSSNLCWSNHLVRMTLNFSWSFWLSSAFLLWQYPLMTDSLLKSVEEM